jgi:hypothetical protein
MIEIPAVVGLCYDAGWRDKNLIAMVAIVGAETNYDESFSNGNRLGLFALRVNSADSDALLNPQNAARIARKVYEEKYFVEWPSWYMGKYLQYVKPAVEGAGEFYVSLFEKELIGG